MNPIQSVDRGEESGQGERMRWISKSCAFLAVALGLFDFAAEMERSGLGLPGMEGPGFIAVLSLAASAGAGIALIIKQGRFPGNLLGQFSHAILAAATSAAALMVWDSVMGLERVSPESAGGFLLVNLALIFLDRRWLKRIWLAQWLAMTTLLVALLAILGHAYHAEIFFRVASLKPMSLQSAVILLVLSVGILSARPERGWMATLLSESAGGIMARYSLPVAVIAVLTFNGLNFLGWRLGLFDPPLAVAISTLGDLVLLGFVILWEAGQLQRLDQERQRVRQNLRDAEFRYRTLFEQSPDGIVVLDPDSTLPLDFNLAACRQLGYSREEFRHLQVADYECSENPPEIKAHLVAILEKGRHDFETKHRTKSGEVREVWVTAQRIDLAGQPAVYSLLRDITDRKRLESKLRASRQEFERFFQASPLAIAIATLANGDLIAVNESFFRITGFSFEEALHHTTRELGLWVDPEQRDQLVRQAQGGNAAASLECQFRTKSGEVRDGLVSADIFELRGQDCIIFNFIDITEKKQLEEQYFRAQRMEIIGTLASGIAHDLNNVLAPVLIAAPILRESVTDPEALSLVEMVERSAQRGTGVINQLLTFGRGMEGNRVPVDLKHLVREIEKVVEETFPKSIRLATDYPPEPCQVHGDVNQLYQVLLNLCVNARDAMPDGGNLSLKIENLHIENAPAGLEFHPESGPYVRISVADSGMGIPDHIKNDIFRPFFTTKDPGKGTGLGLATTVKIVHSHRGWVDLQSKVGRGSQFIVHLPAAPADQEMNPRNGKVEHPPSQGELILIVDDEAMVRRSVKRTLEREGYRTLLAGNGTEAILLLTRNADIRLVLTDLDMPPPTGKDLVRTLSQINPEVKIISMSGHVQNDELPPGLSAFLRKPFTRQQLLHTITHVLYA